VRRVRHAEAGDLSDLEALYAHLNPARPLLTTDDARRILDEILENRAFHLFVCHADGQMVSSCILALIPNLMHGGRPHALIENVVTHADHRRKSHGRAVIQAALDHAWEQRAYQVMLLSGRKDPSVRAFYESCGFETGLKTGYLARSPWES
jgi:GNAT superfamily N-acetyltransferase